MMLKDRVAIVTGAARGIGQEYSLGLVREGAKVVVTDLLSCDETAAKVRQAGGDVLALKTDVTSEQSTRAMAEETVQRFGRIDVLVNNAGLFGGRASHAVWSAHAPLRADANDRVRTQPRNWCDRVS